MFISFCSATKTTFLVYGVLQQDDLYSMYTIPKDQTNGKLDENAIKHYQVLKGQYWNSRIYQ